MHNGPGCCPFGTEFVRFEGTYSDGVTPLAWIIVADPDDQSDTKRQLARWCPACGTEWESGAAVAGGERTIPGPSERSQS